MPRRTKNLIGNAPVIIAAGLLLALFAVWFGGSVQFFEFHESDLQTKEDRESRPEERVLVTEVIDGDTFVIARGNFVRLIGIDAPEKTEHFSAEATNALKNLVQNKTVTLVSGAQDRDVYGRLLRYVYIGEVFVNEELVLRGYARTLIIPPNTRYASILGAAENEARENERGLWGTTD